MYTTNKSSTAPSFSAAFIIVTDLINVCSSGSGSTELHIDRELYAFAPDSRYSGIPPSNVTCSNANYTLTFVASSSSSSLRLEVLASPPSSSCCSLLLKGQHCSDGGTLSIGPSDRSTLLYSCDGCSDGNRPGCTLRVAVVSATTTSSQTTTASERATSQLTSASSPYSDTSNCSTATLPNTTKQPCSTRPLSATASSLGSSSLLSSALSATYATDAAPSSSTNCSPELLGVLPCSPYSSRNSSPSMSGNATNSSASDVTLVVAASVGTMVAVAIVVAVAAFFAKCRCRLQCEEAGTQGAILSGLLAVLSRFTLLELIHRMRRRRGSPQISFLQEPESFAHPNAILQKRPDTKSDLSESTYRLERGEPNLVSVESPTHESKYEAVAYSVRADNPTATSPFALGNAERLYSRLDVSVIDKHEYAVISDDLGVGCLTRPLAQPEQSLKVIASAVVAGRTQEPYCTLEYSDSDNHEYDLIVYNAAC